MPILGLALQPRWTGVGAQWVGAGPPPTRRALVSRHFSGLREPAVLPRSCGTEAPTLAYCPFIKRIITSEMIDGLEGHQPAVVG